MQNKKKLRLVSDDLVLRQAVLDQLMLDKSLEVTQSDILPDATLNEAYDLIILDVKDDKNPEHACQNGQHAPIIALSDKAHKLPFARICIQKPFKLEALLAAVDTQLHWQESHPQTNMRIGPYTFWPALRKLSNETNQTDLRLTEKETAILMLLHKSLPNSVSRDALLEEVWGYQSEMDTHTLETHIYRLRQKIEPVDGKISLLITEEGGYRLAGS